MRAVGADFLRALRGSHRMVSRIRVCTTFQTGTTPDGIVVPLIDGDIRYDASADVRATLDVSVPGEYWTDDPAGLVTPYGNEIYVERGLVLYGGKQVYVGQGYYRIDSTDQDEVPDGDVRVAAKDRMVGIVEARLEEPVQFSAGSSVEAVFDRLVLEVYPNATIEYDFDAAATTFPGSHIADEDRFDFLNAIVTGLGKIWYWDYRGVLVVLDAPELSDPVWTVDAGADGVLVGMSRERSRQGVYNAVVVNGEGTNTFRAVARDVSRKSPTYYYGKFGKVPRFFSSPLIISQAGASSASQKILERSLGMPYSVNFRTVVNPALEVYDPILINYSDRRPTQLHILDKLTLPLGVDGAMTAETRDLTDVDIEVSE